MILSLDISNNSELSELPIKKPSFDFYIELINMQCRKMLTRKSTVAAAKRKHKMENRTPTINPAYVRERVCESIFRFKNYCVFCRDEANEEAEKKKAQNGWSCHNCI